MVPHSGMIMDLNILEESISYKDDVVGMVETRDQRKKNNDGNESDDIHKKEDGSNMR